ncbi:MAG TPA: methionyl-tRNA formyltransferase [Gemmataceae bacterium]|nr:methionyl-tRNA formyltransferase [Gemmataceae bacterium]
MRLVMMGTGTFAEPTFEALLASPHQVVGLVTQPDRPAGQERGSTRQTGRGMKTIAQEHHIPVYQPESINTPEGVARLKEWAPDLLVVAAYGQILSNDVLSVPRHGGINVHASLLPKYRGAAPIAWAIYHGETRTGVTIIKMSVHLDAGDMLAQEAIDIGPEETAGELEARLAPLGARLVVRVIDQIAAGTVQGVKQDQALATRAPKLTKEHGLIDWTRTAAQVCNHVRAMQPWPTAYTFLHRAGQPPLRVLITRAVPFPVRHDPSAAPGTIFTDSRRPGALLVAAGLVSPEERTVVEVTELQPAGKRRMAAAEFLRGHPPREGDHFGPEKS